MLELVDDDFKAAVIRMLQQVITNSLETDEKREHLIKDIERSCKKEPNRKVQQQIKYITSQQIFHLTCSQIRQKLYPGF